MEPATMWMLTLGLIIGFAIGLAVAQRRHTAELAKLKDQVDYKAQWQEAVSLLGYQGRLTEEQISKILPPESVAASKLPTKDGFSEDRKKAEIDRAKAGLQPDDSLEGMFSADILAVQKARIKYGTAR